ncbi:molybdopterin-dependent oxidoreductase [Bacillus subtilis]|uniref:molybdopterin-dependent oxidoreductase n=1 Tax=Bacillus subtilis TaxID=1423 RepID=UPI001C240DAA|nr:molybdopterin-dependent oxidoreductase [Bacillus subtilis]MBU8624426.1 molybdopterin-dependent oxidoreductase [Bacillus subtilis]
MWHLGIPDLNNREWMLSINGMVDRPNQFSLEGLKAFPQTTVMAFHECAGNPLNPKVPHGELETLFRKESASLHRAKCVARKVASQIVG